VFQAKVAGPLTNVAEERYEPYTVADAAGSVRPPRAAGVARGKNGVRKVFAKLLRDLPAADWDLKNQIFDGDLLFLEWSADSATSRVDDGVDTFVFRDGMVRAQTVRYTAQPKG
jgi:hypothetical protein